MKFILFAIVMGLCLLAAMLEYWDAAAAGLVAGVVYLGWRMRRD